MATGDPWNVATELFPEDMPVKRTCQKLKTESEFANFDNSKLNLNPNHVIVHKSRKQM